MSRGENCFEEKSRLKIADLAEPARAAADKKGQTWIGGGLAGMGEWSGPSTGGRETCVFVHRKRS